MKNTLKVVLIGLAGIGVGALLDAFATYWLNDRQDQRRHAEVQEHLSRIDNEALLDELTKVASRAWDEEDE